MRNPWRSLRSARLQWRSRKERSSRVSSLLCCPVERCCQNSTARFSFSWDSRGGWDDQNLYHGGAQGLHRGSQGGLIRSRLRSVMEIVQDKYEDWQQGGVEEDHYGGDY